MNRQITEVNDKNFQPVVLHFGPAGDGAKWCGPCGALAPTIEALASDWAERARVGKLNVDPNPQITERYGVRAIPTLVLFKDGEAVGRMLGALSKNEIERKVHHQI